MKQHILPFLIGLCWMHLAFTQPIVIVQGSENALAIKEQIMQYLDELDISENIHLSVNFTTLLSKYVKGITFCLNALAPNAYQIIRVRIDAHLNKTEQSRVLAHEMVHVKQFAKGELILINSQQVIWKGQKYWCVGGSRQTTPWEVEAHQIDKILAGQDKVQPEAPLATTGKNQ
jgi:hypothetical protein